MWEIIKAVIDKPNKKPITLEHLDDKCTDTFNAYFTSIGPKLAERIPGTESNVDCPIIHARFFLGSSGRACH